MQTIRIRNRAVGKKKRIADALVFVLLLAFCCVILYPFMIAVTMSLKTTKEAALNPIGLPETLLLSNYSDAFLSMNFMSVFGNSVFLTIFSLIGIIVCSGIASYVIAWSDKKKLYNLLYLFFISGIMIPFHTTLVPLTKLMKNLGLLNSLPGMVLFYIGRNMPMAIFLYTGFVRGVSREILEAGRIDGANVWQLYWKVLFPIMVPITSTIIVLDAMNIWNDFLFPRIVLTSKANRTITLAQFFFKTENMNRWNLAFAAYVLTITPIIVFYFLFQRNIVSGVAAGAVKG